MTEPSSPDKGPGSSDDLGRRLRQFREERDISTGRNRPSSESRSGLGYALRLGVELVAALIVGVGLGYLLDTWFGTMPIFALLGFFFGAAAGFMNVYRVATGQGSTVGYRKQREGGSPPDTKRDTNEG